MLVLTYWLSAVSIPESEHPSVKQACLLCSGGFRALSSLLSSSKKNLRYSPALPQCRTPWGYLGLGLQLREQRVSGQMSCTPRASVGHCSMKSGCAGPEAEYKLEGLEGVVEVAGVEAEVEGVVTPCPWVCNALGHPKAQLSWSLGAPDLAGRGSGPGVGFHILIPSASLVSLIPSASLVLVDPDVSESRKPSKDVSMRTATGPDSGYVLIWDIA